MKCTNRRCSGQTFMWIESIFSNHFHLIHTVPSLTHSSHFNWATHLICSLNLLPHSLDFLSLNLSHSQSRSRSLSLSQTNFPTRPCAYLKITLVFNVTLVVCLLVSCCYYCVFIKGFRIVVVAAGYSVFFFTPFVNIFIVHHGQRFDYSFKIRL